jgi:hypothetical protein
VGGFGSGAALMRRFTPPQPFVRAAIDALGAPPPPPIPTAERSHVGKIRGTLIWTEPLQNRIRRAHAIGSIEGVVAAFPGWSITALRTAVMRYVHVGSVIGEPAPAPSREEIAQRFAAIPLDQIAERVYRLVRGGPPPEATVEASPTIARRLLTALAGGGEFTVAQLAQMTGAYEDSVRGTLVTLKRKGIVTSHRPAGARSRYCPHLWRAA